MHDEYRYAQKLAPSPDQVKIYSNVHNFQSKSCICSSYGKIAYMHVSNAIYRRLKYRYTSSNAIAICVLDGTYTCVHNYAILII